ncbi:MAG: hypothetical protein J1F61_05950 [Clostridiales bacterium]|nr:hypothetical protein [Clostridiales bacterium]
MWRYKQINGNDNNVKKALLKCATGLSASETVEEFAVQDGELKLVKKKVTKREIPPDIKAVKLLMEGRDELTDEELEAEKQKLMDMLEED